MNFLIPSYSKNFYYFTGFEIDNSFLLSLDGERYLFTTKLNKYRAEQYFNNVIVDLKDFNNLMKGKNVLIDGEITCYDRRKFKAKFYYNNIFYKIRSKKFDYEVKRIKRAVKITKKIFSFNPFDFRTELEIYNYLLSETYEMGFEPAFMPIVTADSSTKFPHYTPRNKKIKKFVLIDYGVKYKGYVSDLTRMFFYRENSAEKEMYNEMKNIFNDIISNFDSFKIGKDIANFYSSIYKEKNWQILHAIGHGIGLEVHEYPRLNMKSKDSLFRTTMAIEPGYYNNKFGVRFEENIFYDGKKVILL